MADSNKGTFQGGRIPPHQSERRLIGLLVSYPETFKLAAGSIREEFFYAEDVKKLFSDMVRLTTDGKTITISNLVSLGSDIGYIESIISGEEFIPGDIDLIIDLVIEEFQLRKYEETALYIQHKAQTGDKDGCIEFVEAATKISEITSNAEDESQAVIDALTELEKKKKRKEEHPDTIFGTRTGFPDMDKVTGGWQPGDLIVIGARPSVGKTALSLHMGNQASSLFGVPVGMASLEMPKNAIINRQLAWISGVDSESIRDANYDEGDWERVVEAAKVRHEMKFYIDDKCHTTSQIVGAAMKMHSRYGIKLFIVDYLQMMKGVSKEKRIEVGDNALALKNVGKALGIPIILLSQLSRFKTSRPQMSDLRESGDIEAHADLIYLLWNNPDENYTEIDLVKHRNGSLNMFFKVPDKKTGFYYDINSYGSRNIYSKGSIEDVPF